MRSDKTETMPREMIVLGIPYQIEYCDNPADVDREKQEARWGEVDYWTRTIRIYEGKRPLTDIWRTLFHELLHAIDQQLHLELFVKREDQMDSLALGILDTLVRNGWLVLEKVVLNA